MALLAAMLVISVAITSAPSIRKGYRQKGSIIRATWGVHLLPSVTGPNLLRLTLRGLARRVLALEPSGGAGGHYL
jgi:hypothetical protein